MISKSVGSQGANSFDDTVLVQSALNVVRSRKGQQLLTIDGIAGPKTFGAITDFQRSMTGLVVDGRVDPSGATLAKLLASIGGDAFVFAPIIRQLLDIKSEFERVSLFAPPAARAPFLRVMGGLTALNAHKELASAMGSSQGAGTTGFGFNAGPPRFGVTGVDDAIAAATLAMMALLLAAFLILLVQSPAFQKAVSVRAKELDRILKDLQINTKLGIKESIDLIIEITSDNVQEAEKCRQSPTFQDSIACRLAIQQFERMAAKIRNITPRLIRLRDIVTSNPRSGFDIRRERAKLLKLIAEVQDDLQELQTRLGELKDTCNCPDV